MIPASSHGTLTEQLAKLSATQETLHSRFPKRYNVRPSIRDMQIEAKRFIEQHQEKYRKEKVIPVGWYDDQYSTEPVLLSFKKSRRIAGAGRTGAGKTVTLKQMVFDGFNGTLDMPVLQIDPKHEFLAMKPQRNPHFTRILQRNGIPGMKHTPYVTAPRFVATRDNVRKFKISLRDLEVLDEGTQTLVLFDIFDIKDPIGGMARMLMQICRDSFPEDFIELSDRLQDHVDTTTKNLNTADNTAASIMDRAYALQAGNIMSNEQDNVLYEIPKRMMESPVVIRTREQRDDYYSSMIVALALKILRDDHQRAIDGQGGSLDKPFAVCIDEAQFVAPSQRKTAAGEEIATFASTQRSRGVSLVVASQKLSRMHKVVIDSCDTFVYKGKIMESEAKIISDRLAYGKHRKDLLTSRPTVGDEHNPFRTTLTLASDRGLIFCAPLPTATQIMEEYTG